MSGSTNFIIRTIYFQVWFEFWHISYWLLLLHGTTQSSHTLAVSLACLRLPMRIPFLSSFLPDLDLITASAGFWQDSALLVARLHDSK